MRIYKNENGIDHVIYEDDRREDYHEDDYDFDRVEDNLNYDYSDFDPEDDNDYDNCID